ncbi:MAG: hypothetical protein GTO18_18595 [Anaerolineales bacterium]|nr:hypothetical protein [Anaerolineales bacterium]
MNIWNHRWIHWLLLTVLLVGSVGGYLIFSQQTHGLGYPLDDAWIHQTYARNLLEYREWSFVPDHPSAGSTSPLWTIFLAVGPVVGLNQQLWTYLAGGLVLLLLAVVCMQWFADRFPEGGRWKWAIGLIVILEWHLTWASVSGMETLAFALLVAVVLWQITRKLWSPFWIGLLIGVGVWIRPGGLSLIVPVVAAIFTQEKRRWVSYFVKACIGIILGIAPYLLFNYWLTGSLWPNTFYAKQAEYAVHREKSIILRYLDQFLQPLIGASVLLLPGWVLTTLRDLRKRDLTRLTPFIWVIVFLGTYAFRLPVIYQHGRYAMPVIPVILVLGFEGLVRWIDLNSSMALKRIISRFWLLSTFVILLAYWLIGARSYAQDVAIIETEMVAAANWIAVETEEDAVIAAHDIGALGFYGKREILDLAGLVSPEVIPIIRDEDALQFFLNEHGADYLMTFPDWYPILSQVGELVYRSGGTFSPASGGENMAIYRWGY